MVIALTGKFTLLFEKKNLVVNGSLTLISLSVNPNINSIYLNGKE